MDVLKLSHLSSTSPSHKTHKVHSNSPSSFQSLSTSSQLIINDVINTKIPKSPSSPKLKSSTTTNQPNQPHVVIEQDGLPLLPYDTPPWDRVDFFSNYLFHSKHEVRLLALEEIRRYHSQAKSSSAIAEKVLSRIFQALSSYHTQRVLFIQLAIEVIPLYNSSTLVNYTPIHSLPLLTLILSDPSISHPLIQQAIIKTMASLGRPGFGCLIEVASTIPNLSHTILNTLCNFNIIKSSTIVPLLCNYLISTPTMRPNCLLALSLLKHFSTTSIPILFEMLTKGATGWSGLGTERNEIAKAIRLFGLDGDVVLLQLLKENQDFRVRLSVAKALSSYPNLDNSKNSRSPSDLKILVKCESNEIGSPVDPPQFTFEKGVLHLTIDSRDFLSFLKKAVYVNETLLKPTDPCFLSRNVHVTVPSHNIISALLDAMNDVNIDVRVASVISIGSYGLPLAFPVVHVLQKQLNNDTPIMKVAIIKALGMLGPDLFNESLTEDLVNLLKDSFYKVRKASCETLSVFGSKASHLALPALLKVFHSGTVSRGEVAKAIVSMGILGEQALQNILQNSSTFSLQSKIAALYGLGMVDIDALAQAEGNRAEEILQLLFEHAHNSSPIIRLTSLTSLGLLFKGKRNDYPITNLRPSTLLPFFYGFLQDSESNIREIAAQCIGESFEDGGELLLVEAVVRDPNPVIRSAAVFGLFFVGARSVRTLLVALTDKVASVRDEAGKSLESIGIQSICDVLCERPAQHLEAIIFYCNQILHSSLRYPQSLKQFLKALKEKVQGINVLNDQTESQQQQQQ